MASNHPAKNNRAIRRHLQEIALTPLRTSRPIEVKILVDKDELYRLPRIEKRQPLIWKDLMLPCDLRNDSVLAIRVTEVHQVTPDITGLAVCPASSIINQDNGTFGCDNGKFTVKVSFMSQNEAKAAYEEALARVQRMEAPKSLLNKYGKYGAAFTTLLALGTALSELDPSGGAKVAFSVCTKAWQHLEKQEKQEKEIDDLVEQIARMTPTIESVQDIADADLRDTIIAMLNLIEDASIFILSYRSRSAWAQALSSFVDSSAQDRTKDLVDRFMKLREEFDRRVGTQTLKVGTQTFTIAQSNSDGARLKELNPVGHASYNPNRECIPGTRVRLIEDTVRWAQDYDTGQQLLWVYGFAGLGKSSVATSVCLRLKEEGLLAASFFCKRDDPLLRDAECLLNTVIFELATRHEGYKRAVANAIQEDPQICTTHIQRRYASLVEAPLKSLGKSQTSGNCVIVVDALDETRRNESRGTLLTCLRNMCQLVPWLKIIVTSRPDEDIKAEIGGNKKSIAARNIADHNAADDIHTFIQRRMADVAKQKNRAEWPTNTIQQLASRANGLFVWAETACKFIAGGLSPDKRLKQVLEASRSAEGSHPLAALDELYETAIHTGIQDEGADNRSIIRDCLGAIVAVSARTPLPVADLERLLLKQMEPGVLRSVVIALGSVVYEDGGAGGPVRVFHPSFEDYLTDRDRTNEFYVDMVQQNSILAFCCLDVMLCGLKFNICNLETSHVFNRDIPDLGARVHAAIAGHLRYSCLYWYSHLVQAEMGPIEESLKSLLFAKELMYWLEALSLLGKLDIALSSMTGLATLALKSNGLIACSSYANDVYRFVLSFYDAISESTPHLYISALPFTPTASEFGRRMRPLFPNTLAIAQGADERWTSSLRTISHPGEVNCVAFSPDSRRIVSGCNDSTVRIWDAETGAAILNPLRGHSHRVWCAVFSPNGSRIASGSLDCTIRIWDAGTGSTTVGPLQGHSGYVHCVAFSPNGQRIVSCAADRTVRVWDAETGRAVLGPLEGHSDQVKSVAFSADGHYIASGSRDHTVIVRDAETGAIIHGPLRCHSDSVLSVAFSHDSSLLVSGSADRTLVIWDAKTGTQMLDSLRGHTDLVQSVVFSSDDRRIVSGSADGTVRFWDVESGSELAGQPRSHSHRIWSVAFSPDGRRVASASADKTIQIWDAEQGVDEQPASQIFSAPINSVAFSPDGRSIVSGSSDKILRIWDAATGVASREPLVGHTGPVWSVTFSRDGRRIASGSADLSILIWDPETGSAVLEPLQGHTYSVFSVAFSPDDRLIASGSGDATVRIWNAETGATVLGPLEGHSDALRSVAFSPDSSFLISGSDDMTVRVWDAKAGVLLQLLQGHVHQLCSVAFSPNSEYIASGSRDETLRIWDAKTGKLVRILRGHTENVQSVAFSPDGRWVASCSADQTLRIWAAETGTTALEPLRGHSQHVRSIAFSPDGRHMVSGSDDGTLRLWDGEPRATTLELPPSLGDQLTRTTSELAHLADPNGWITSANGELLIWLPGNYRRIDDSLMCMSPEPMPPRTIIHFSEFVHGRSWTLVAA